MSADATIYEVAGVVDASAADAVGKSGNTILVEQEESNEYLIARPRDGDADE